ncbi:MAG: hypothetical protein CFE41_21245 [Burkholderiales bacterium PBB2]|nr:MAG: hypothetical protein CFE41_21245 [Burkholderiales bacterium PBB2]
MEHPLKPAPAPAPATASAPRRRQRASAPATLLATALTLASPQVWADVQLEILLAPPGALELRYTPSGSCRTLTLAKQSTVGDSPLRANWQPLDDCSLIDPGKDQIQLSRAACSTARFRVPVTTQHTPAYQPAFPISDAAVYAHTSNFATTPACGPLQVVVRAPAVAAEGQMHAGGLTLPPARGADTAVLLLREKPADSQGQRGVPSVLDPKLSPDTIALIQRLADGTIELLRQELPDAPFRMPIITATMIRNGGTPHYEGDAADVLRLALFNWDEPLNAERRSELTQFVSHEFSHRFQAFLDAQHYRDERLIHEGGAEFLRWLLGLRLGWLSPEAAARDLDQALSDCLLGTADLAWGRLPPGRISGARLAYRCGLPAIALAAASAAPAAPPPFARVNGFYREVRAQARPDFAQAVECGAPRADCQPRWLPRLLGEQEPMGQVWAELARKTGLLQAGEPTADDRRALMIHAISQLMREDCGGRRSLYPAEDGIGLDAMPEHCKTLRPGMYAQRVAGHALFNDPQALNALLDSCRQTQTVALGLRDGRSVSLACSAGYQPPVDRFYRVQIEPVLQGLGLARKR